MRNDGGVAARQTSRSHLKLRHVDIDAIARSVVRENYRPPSPELGDRIRQVSIFGLNDPHSDSEVVLYGGLDIAARSVMCERSTDLTVVRVDDFKGAAKQVNATSFGRWCDQCTGSYERMIVSVE